MESEDKKVIEVENPRSGKIEILAISSRMTLSIDKKIKRRQRLIEDVVESFEWIEEKHKSNPEIPSKLEEISKIRDNVNEIRFNEDIKEEEKRKIIKDSLEKISDILDSLPDKYAEMKVDRETKSEEINTLSYEIIKKCYRCIGGTPEYYENFSEFVDDIIEHPDDLEFFIDFFLTHCTFFTKSRSEQRFKVVER